MTDIWELFREEEERRDGEQRAAMREQVAEILIEKVDIVLPAKLSETQMSRTIEQQRMELVSRGLDENAVEKRLAETRGRSETVSKNRIKLFFIMSRLQEHFGVNITEQELNGRIASMAAQQMSLPRPMVKVRPWPSIPGWSVSKMT